MTTQQEQKAPIPCPHCGATLLWSEDRGAHCDGCDEFNEAPSSPPQSRGSGFRCNCPQCGSTPEQPCPAIEAPQAQPTTNTNPISSKLVGEAQGNAEFPTFEEWYKDWIHNVINPSQETKYLYKIAWHARDAEVAHWKAEAEKWTQRALQANTELNVALAEKISLKRLMEKYAKQAELFRYMCWSEQIQADETLPEMKGMLYCSMESNGTPHWGKTVEEAVESAMKAEKEVFLSQPPEQEPKPCMGKEDRDSKTTDVPENYGGG